MAVGTLTTVCVWAAVVILLGASVELLRLRVIIAAATDKAGRERQTQCHSVPTAVHWSLRMAPGATLISLLVDWLVPVVTSELLRVR